MPVKNIKVEAMKAYYGENVKQIEQITISPVTLKADLASAFIETYAVLAGNIVKHVFWFDTTGTDVAPVVVGATLHKVDISGGSIDTAPEFATTLQGVIDGLTAIYSATVLNNVITFNGEVVGYAPAAQDAKDPAAKTNFGLIVLVQGDTKDELGCIKGDIEVSFEESFIDVLCHAEGVTPVAQLKTGVSKVEITMDLEETSTAQLKKMFVKTGGSYIPDGGSEVFGMGTYKNFENMFKYATILNLHPARLLDADLSEDYNFWKAIPNLKGITFSGENVFTLPVTFSVFPDETKDPRISYWAKGNGAQNLNDIIA